jgi:peptidoglycan/xylan/chitin deacetylase (PgdA/CDA1 family)
VRHSQRVTRLLDRAGGFRFLASINAWRGILLLNYHRIAQTNAHVGGEIWSATVDELDAELCYLAERLEFAHPEALLDRRRPRGRRVIITFDDGYRDTYKLALPLLRKYDASAIFFLTTGFIDGCCVAWWDEIDWMINRTATRRLPGGSWFPEDLVLDDATSRRAAAVQLGERYKELPGDRTEPFMNWLADTTGIERQSPSESAGKWITWEMAREFLEAGMYVGGHTVKHPVLARLPLVGQRQEIMGCRDRLLEELGIGMELFSYPVGRPDSFDAGTMSCLREAGVHLAFSYYGGYARWPLRNPYDVPRTSVWLGMEPARFRALVSLPMALARW